MGRLCASAPLNLPGLGLYPSIPEPRRRVVAVRVPRTLSTIKYDYYKNIPRSAPMEGLHSPKPPWEAGLGLYS